MDPPSEKIENTPWISRITNDRNEKLTTSHLTHVLVITNFISIRFSSPNIQNYPFHRISITHYYERLYETKFAAVFAETLKPIGLNCVRIYEITANHRIDIRPLKGLFSFGLRVIWFNIHIYIIPNDYKLQYTVCSTIKVTRNISNASC